MKTQLIKSKYEILELLREDIISLCYKGVTHYSKHPLIIWEYKAEFLDSNLVTRLINISEKLVQFQHPQLLNMIDYYYDGSSFYSIFESPGSFVTLDTYIKQAKKLDLNRLWKYASQLLTVLLKFEQQGLNCGTVNFSDLIVSSSAQIKLSRSTIPIEIYKKNKDDLEVIEDSVFLAPEFLLNGAYTSLSDMYSFGVLLFVFFSQKWPFKYTIKVDQMKKEILKGPQEFEAVHARIPDRLAQMISVCLKPDADHRFRSFLELIKVYRGDMELKPVSHQESGVKEHLQDDLSQRKLTYVMTWVKRLSFILVFFVCFYVFQRFYVSYITSIPEVAVPNVINQEAYEAEELLEQHQLRSLVSGARFHPTIEKGYVIEAKPPVGRVVKENRLIRLFVSKGAGPILLPDLVGYSKENASKVLDERGIQVEIVDEAYSLQYEEGAILSQKPNPNTFIGPSENVQLVLSKGYPLDMTVKKAKPSFFQDKSHLRRVIVEFFILKEWPDQDISIYFDFSGERRKIYSDLVKSGDELSLEFELDFGGVIEVYFADELTLKRVISDEQDAD